MQNSKRQGINKCCSLYLVTNNEAFIFVKAYSCYNLFLVHWQITNNI